MPQSPFVHLHNHSHYSILDGLCKVDEFVKKAKSYGMESIAITDHGNMFGAIEFYKAATKEKIKPIIGCEVYITRGSLHDRGKNRAGGMYHLILLAKNETGYQNLMTLSSIGYLEGFYYKPRIDKELLKKHSEGLICLTACLKGEVANLINREQFSDARATAKEYKDIFGEDFYLELQNHGIKEEEIARNGAIKIAKELGIKTCATNDIHYIEEKHWEAHDILLCLQSGEELDSPNRLRYSTHDIYFKSGDQMCELFKNQPQAIESTLEIADKINLKLNFDYKYPKFPIPESSGCKDEVELFEKICREGFEKRYGKSAKKGFVERYEFEMDLIKKMGFTSYFLIVQDFIGQARLRGIPVGPGRGSAGGSMLAYCMGITNLDPMPYNLLFERFLNPERVSMPDVDIDFCMRRREEVIDYVKQKYGNDNVTQVITYGKLAPKAVLKDVARILKISYGEADKLSKAIPVSFGKPMPLAKAIEQLPEFREKVAQNDETYNKLFDFAQTLEGLNRQTGKHAAAVVIAPDNLLKFTPLYRRSAEEDVTTQFDMKSVETIGLLKMDFLGLKTLTVIYDTLELLKVEGITLDIESIPIDDKKTYQLFADGYTVGVFQFESAGMREYLKKLKPERIEDLIAMNALYRPGPMDNIPSFIERKFGREEVDYPHPCLEKILKETYGIMVYQEQIMQIASELCDFSLGKADLLRRAMGKKDIPEMEKMKPEFIEGAIKKHDVSKIVANEVWDLIFRFANYGFNKSHSACYSWLAYQTAYLKAHFPAHFMAAMMTSEMSSKDGVPKLIEECKKLDIHVLPPDINESVEDFTVIGKKIRFGLRAVKNVGANAITEITNARKKHGKFKDIFDVTANVDTKICSKKTLESLILAGACDSLEGTRAKNFTSLEIAIDYGQKLNQKSTSFSLFETSETVVKPKLLKTKPYEKSKELQDEKELIGFYISGHPLENFKSEVMSFSTIKLNELENIPSGKEVHLCGLVSKFKMLTTKAKQERMCTLEIEDFFGSIKVLVFPKAYNECKDVIKNDLVVKVSGKIDFEDENDVKILADKIITISDATEQDANFLTVEIDTNEVDKNNLLKIKTIVEKSPGKCKVLFKLIANDGETYKLQPDFTINPSQELLTNLRGVLGEKQVWIN